MRIAYVSLHWPRTRNSGVGKKIQSQLAAWNVLGHEARLFMHTSEYEPQSDLIEADHFFYSVSGKLKTEPNRIAAMVRMIEAIQKFRPDVIYLRYSIYVFPAHRLMDIAPVVEEINTNDLTQHEQLGFIYGWYNRLTRGIFLRRVRGLVAVSRELAFSPAFASYRKPTVTIANGIDLESIRPLPPPTNETPRLFFIATPGYSWHGVDKLVTLARMQPDLRIDVVGYDHIDNAGPLPANVHLHGYLGPEEYRNVLAEADVALSTLALHRKDMQEASPLKTRECLAYGLPMILAYADTDLDALQCDFLLKIPNRDDNIETHAARIREFAYAMRGRRVDRQLIRERIDSAAKEGQRLAFFEQVIRDAK
jgi:glycosyltransferase involved in cell wall biosynthesis